MTRESGCDGVMIGRATLGNPWIFAQALAIERGEEPALPGLGQRREVALRHFRLLTEGGSGRGAVVNFRRCLMWYSRGLPRSANFRAAVSRQGSLAELRGELERYFDSVEREAA